MTTLTLASAAAILMALVATPALAEPMNQEPGLAAFYHPDRDPNDGSAVPIDAMAMARGNMAVMNMKMRLHAAQRRR